MSAELSAQERLARQVAQDYRRHFYEPESGKRLLGELAAFCKGYTSAFDQDPIIMARNVGRQEVWVHIMSLLRLNEEQRDAILEAWNRARMEVQKP